MKSCSIPGSLCLWSFTVAVSAAGDGDASVIARRAAPFLEQEGLAWIEERECASCHQVPSMLWSLHSLTRAGLLTGKGPAIGEWTAWAADWRHWNQTGDKEGAEKVSAGNVDTMAFLLLGRDRSAPSPAWVSEFRERLIIHQQPDGSWKAGGQQPLARRPPREIAEVTTLWALLALRSVESPALPAAVESRALAFLGEAKPGRSTEWHVARLLLDPADPSALEALRKSQTPDGGWGWLAGEKADAFGTGLALFGLARAGTPADDPARLRAVAFLGKHQREDGSWPVPSTRAKDGGKVTATATYWGSAWATIGLLEPPANAARKP